MLRPRVQVGFVFYCVLLVNILSFIGLFVDYFGFVSLTGHPKGATFLIKESSEASEESNKPMAYYFDNKEIAIILLKLFNKPEPIPDQFFRSDYHLGLIREDKYCEKSLEAFIKQPELLFWNKIVLTDYEKYSLFRETVLSKVGTDIMPQVDIDQLNPKTKKLALYKFDLTISMYYIKGGIHFNYEQGKHYGCNHQIYNHVYGAIELNRKSNLALNYYSYFKKYEDKPQCAEHFMPRSYILKDTNQCKEFFDYLNSPEYQIEKSKHKYTFFLKIGMHSHRGTGVFLFTEEHETSLRNEFKNGNDCSDKQADLQLQKYITNPMLLDGHKFDFRVYLLIASVNPLIVYYHDGFLKLSMQKYDPNSTEKGVHLSNTELSKEIFEQSRKPGGWNGMNETEIRKFQTWLYYRLQAYLLEKNFTKDPHWVENSMIPQMQKAMMHVARMTKDKLVPRSPFYELFGCDFILDDNLKIWLIECNTNPMMEATTEEREKLLINMLNDHFELMYAYLRSRMKRVILFINNLQKEIVVEEETQEIPFKIFIPHIESKIEEYNAINKNYLDPEFEVKPTNGFKKIMDENLSDESRYSGFIPKECF